MDNQLTAKLNLSVQEKARIGGWLGKLKSIAGFFSDAAEAVGSTSLAKAVADAAPWAGIFGHALAEVAPPVKFAVELIKGLTEEHDPDALGFLAATLAYQRSVEQIITSFESPDNARRAGTDIRQQLRKLEPSAEIEFSNFSFWNATQHEFVRRADDALRSWVAEVGYGEEQSRKIVLGVHRRFVANLKTILSNGELKEKFEPFTQKMTLGTDEEQAYAALLEHSERQRRLFEEAPVFDKEPFALTHVYVGTECGDLKWGEINKEQKALDRGRVSEQDRIDPFSERKGGRHPLLDTVMGLIGNRKFKDAILIQGVAGSGKSSFTLKLCSELIREGLHPLRVRLRDLNLASTVYITESLPQALFPADGSATETNAAPRPKDLFLGGAIFNERVPFRGAEICPYVLILDGWDEISISATTGYKVRVTKMLEEIRNEYLKNRQVPIRVILTGRPSDAVSASKFLRVDTPVLTMRPLHPEQLRQFVGKLKQALTDRPVPVEVKDEQEELWTIDDPTRFEPVIERYKEEFDASLQAGEQGEPRAPRQVWATESGTLDVLGLPLLAHLAIRMMSRWRGDDFDALVGNPTTLYRSLVDLTSEKGGKAIFDRGEVDDQFRVIGGNLRKLLWQTATAMTVYGEESISFTELARRLGLPDEELDREVDVTTKDHVLSSLMVSFFFKGGQRHLGCEFLHKSFREYLYAEAVVERLKDYGRRQKIAPDERKPYWADFDPARDLRHELSRELSGMVSAQWLSREVVRHLSELIRWEIERAKQGNEAEVIGSPTTPLDLPRWERVRDGLADLWDWWAEGVHLRPQPVIDDYMRVVKDFDKPFAQKLVEMTVPFDPALRNASIEPKRTITMDSHLGDALFRLCALVHFNVANASGWLDSRDDKTSILLPQQIWEGVSPTGQGPRKYQALVRQGDASWVLFSPAGKDPNYFANYCNRINSAGWRPAGPFPLGANMSGIDLRGASVSIPVFAFQRYQETTSWFYANLTRAVFAGSRLSGHQFIWTYAPRAAFTNATADGSFFGGCFMPKCSFSKALLTGTMFYMSTFARADFTDADISGAYFSRTDLRRARLLTGSVNAATFNRVNLEGAKGVPEELLLIHKATSDNTAAIPPAETDEDDRS